ANGDLADAGAHGLQARRERVVEINPGPVGHRVAEKQQSSAARIGVHLFWADETETVGHMRVSHRRAILQVAGAGGVASKTRFVQEKLRLVKHENLVGIVVEQMLELPPLRGGERRGSRAHQVQGFWSRDAKRDTGDGSKKNEENPFQHRRGCIRRPDRSVGEYLSEFMPNGNY